MAPENGVWGKVEPILKRGGLSDIMSEQLAESVDSSVSSSTFNYITQEDEDLAKAVALSLLEKSSDSVKNGGVDNATSTCDTRY
mmetsp:Transcript_1865/g.2409  ORF Transcript_1865/g.2409 Transcript_1865/m.2409 type:complete len:84 (-) Transcript_1865:1615-1866(-)